MAEVELNHANSSNSGTHTSKERLHFHGYKMQKCTKILHPTTPDGFTGRLFQSSHTGLLLGVG